MSCLEILPVFGVLGTWTHIQCWNRAKYARNPRDQSTLFPALKWPAGTWCLWQMSALFGTNDRGCLSCRIVTAEHLVRHQCSRERFEFSIVNLCVGFTFMMHFCISPLANQLEVDNFEVCYLWAVSPQKWKINVDQNIREFLNIKH